MLWVNLPLHDTIHSKGNKFVTDVKVKSTSDSEFDDGCDCNFSQGNPCIILTEK